MAAKRDDEPRWHSMVKIETYQSRLAATKARIAKAAGALQERQGLRQEGVLERQKGPSQALACGCVPEDQEQRALVSWGRSARLTLFWTRAERRESARLRAWARARGALDGMPDLLVLEYPGLAIELKAECKKHKLSQRQEERIAYLRQCGWTVLVAHGARDATEQIRRYQAVTRGPGY